MNRLFFISCFVVINSMMGYSQIDIQGHRGARGVLPENTLRGMIYALDAGVQTLEMDVVITADREVILSHEPWFSHEISTKPDGVPVDEEEEKMHNIFLLSYDEIKQYDIGLRGNPKFPQQRPIVAKKPLLSEVITKVDAHAETKGFKPVFFNIEIKSDPSSEGRFHPAPELYCNLVLDVLKDLPVERYSIQSFDERILQWLYKNRPDVRLVYLFESMDEQQTLSMKIEQLGFTPQIISPNYKLVDKAFMKDAQSLEVKVIPWTINDEDKMKSLEKLGVDGIITDYPDMAVALFGAYNAVEEVKE